MSNTGPLLSRITVRAAILAMLLLIAVGTGRSAHAGNWFTNAFGLGGEPERPGDYNQPHYGVPGTFHAGYPHYEAKQHYYGVWYRPRAFGLQAAERCAPDYWNPRGYGNLFNQPRTPYRMEYNPHELCDPYSRFGPAYFRRLHDAKCSCLSCRENRWQMFEFCEDCKAP